MTEPPKTTPTTGAAEPQALTEATDLQSLLNAILGDSSEVSAPQVPITPSVSEPGGEMPASATVLTTRTVEPSLSPRSAVAAAVDVADDAREGAGPPYPHAPKPFEHSLRSGDSTVLDVKLEETTRAASPSLRLASGVALSVVGLAIGWRLFLPSVGILPSVGSVAPNRTGQIPPVGAVALGASKSPESGVAPRAADTVTGPSATAPATDVGHAADLRESQSGRASARTLVEGNARPTSMVGQTARRTPSTSRPTPEAATAVVAPTSTSSSQRASANTLPAQVATIVTPPPVVALPDQEQQSTPQVPISSGGGASAAAPTQVPAAALNEPASGSAQPVSSEQTTRALVASAPVLTLDATGPEPSGAAPLPSRAARLVSRAAAVPRGEAVGGALTGVVSVQVTVDATGKVRAARSLSGPTLLRDTAEDAARRSRFEPALRDGVPTSSDLTITYTFTLPANDVRTRQR